MPLLELKECLQNIFGHLLNHAEAETAAHTAKCLEYACNMYCRFSSKEYKCLAPATERSMEHLVKIEAAFVHNNEFHFAFLNSAT